MNIINFTPVSALTGGLLIGLSVALFFILNGRMIGVSGIASNFLISKDKKSENLLFLVGLILGPLIYTFILGGEINSDTKFPENDHRHYNINGDAFDIGETFSGVNFSNALKAIEKYPQLTGSKNIYPCQLIKITRGKI